MGIAGGSKPLQGDPLEAAHAAIPAGAIDGELYAAAPTTASVVTDTGSGVVSFTDGEYHITFAIRNPVTDAILGETTSGTGTISNTISPDSEVVDITAIPVSPNDHGNCRRIYRDSGSGTFRLVGEILDNVTTTFTDNVLDTTSQPVMPTTNTTGQTINVNVATNQAGLSIKEAGTEHFNIDGKGIIRKGMVSFAHPYSPDDIIASFARLINNTGGDNTYTVNANEILVITSIVGTLETTANPELDVGGTVIAKKVTTPTIEVKFENNLPILVDTGVVLDSDEAPTWSVLGYTINRTGYITPFIQNPVTSEQIVPASTVRVILGVAILTVAGRLLIEEDTGGSFISVTGETGNSESMVYDEGNEGIARNKVYHPIILQAGERYKIDGIGGTVWGYDIDA